MYRLLLLVLLACMPIAPVHGQELTIDEIIDPAGMIQASLSPDGRHIAAIVYNGTNHGLVLIDTVTYQVRKIREGRFVSWRAVATRYSSPSSAARPASAAPSNAPATASGARRCRTISPQACRT